MSQAKRNHALNAAVSRPALMAAFIELLKTNFNGMSLIYRLAINRNLGIKKEGIDQKGNKKPCLDDHLDRVFQLF